MAFPKATEDDRLWWEDLLPSRADVEVRKMFGNVAAFLDGNMFTGLFGADVFLRLSEGDRDSVPAQGGEPFDPMGGRPMKEYVQVPPEWREDTESLQAWMAKSVAYAERLSPKSKRLPPKRK